MIERVIKVYDDKIRVADNFSYCVETQELIIEIMGRRYDFRGDPDYYFRVIKVLESLSGGDDE